MGGVGMGQGKIEGDDVCTFGNGSLICGECMCKDGRYGKKCECSGDVIGNEEDENESGCRPANATHVCFGRGECVCGECVCNTRPDPREVISGTYCECDNFSCARYKGELCGGPERGDCVCDTKTRQSACKCRAGFQGLACDCPTRQDSCRANNGLICNALGNCTCGECRCDPNSRFQGARCDECATCSEDQCFFHQACLQCKAFNAGRLTKEQCDMCLIEIQEVETLPYVENSKNCSFVDDTDNCSINFAYQTSDDRQKITIFYEKIPICARSMTGSLIEGQNLLILIGGIVLSIVLIGVVLALIYRLWTYIQDRKEYAQWVKDQQDANWEK
ncbi:putative integrin beta-1-A, partial [Apostichopus japonicus]